jgi:xanthine dehydrogenase small subunit
MNARVSAMDGNSDAIRFVLDGRVIELDNVDPTRTVLQFLREDLGRTGTKEGCAEGDCGACTVVLAELHPEGEGVRLRAINSCIQFLPTLDGKELITVESLAESGRLHPVQQAMVDSHASQCGFCTPGFVMSLYALYETNPAPTRRDIDDALAGNLCRCTGYRPIIAAARRMYEASPRVARQHGVDLLKAMSREQSLRVAGCGRVFHAPRSADELAELLTRHADAVILAGGTDIGLWVNKQHRELDTVIYTGCVEELQRLVVSDGHIEIGAAVTLADALPVLVEHFPGLEELLVRFASPPIRNAGTLGGNIANGSPIGDAIPAMMALNAQLVLRRGMNRREVAIEDFYKDYQVKDLQSGEFIESMRLPLVAPGVIVRAHKWSKRFDQDISAVCNATVLELDGEIARSFRMACGGMAATVRRARNAEAAVVGQPWNRATVDSAVRALADDFTPISDMRASADYRLVAAGNLLRRFYLETQGELQTTIYDYGRED